MPLTFPKQTMEAALVIGGYLTIAALLGTGVKYSIDNWSKNVRSVSIPEFANPIDQTAGSMELLLSEKQYQNVEPGAHTSYSRDMKWARSGMNGGLYAKAPF